MKPATLLPVDEARKRLMEEGARCYLKAATALMAYEQAVQRECHEVMQKYFSEYALALRAPFPLNNSEIRNKVWYEGEWRSIGAAVEAKRSPPKFKWWGAYCLVYWQGGNSGFDCYVGEWLSPAKRAEDLFQRFHQLNDQVWHAGKEVGLYRTLSMEQADSFGEVLEDLFGQWIRLWKKVGGMKAVFKP